MKLTRLALLLSLLGSTGAFLHAQDAAQTPDQELAKLREDNKSLSAEVASAWKEVDGLKAKLADAQKQTEQARTDAATAQTSVATNADEVTSLKKQLDDAKNAQAASPDDVRKDLDDTKDKLSMALHSYSLLQDENNQLKDQISKGDGEKATLASQLEFANQSITTLKAQAAIATQVDSLRTQLRNSQDEVAALAGENEKLRTQLALNGSAPGTVRPTPIRPGALVPTDLSTAPASAPLASSPAPAASKPAATPAANAAPRTYTVAEGDTLSKISKKFYGTTGKWETILNANREKLKTDKGLQIGMSLTIP